MKKLLFLATVISLISCNKEDLNGGSDNPTPSTITVSYDNFNYQLYYCIFTYYDVNGTYYANSYQTDKKVENVDMSRPFKVEAQAGISMYQPGGGEIQNPLSTDWQVKQDGVVIDAREAVTYVYQN
jgi:hypothetical protein